MTYLEPLRGRVGTKKFLVLDIESKAGDTQEPGFTRPFQVGVYDGCEYYDFRDDDPESGDWETRCHSQGGCIDKALRFILQPRYRGYTIYAHNGGRFDFLHLMPWFVKTASTLDYSFSVVPVASAIQLLHVTELARKSETVPIVVDGDDIGQKQGPKSKKKAGFTFVDSYRLLPISLQQAAKTFGLKGKLEHDLRLHESDPRWAKYNRRDCIELYKVMQKYHHYVEKKLGGEVGITCASTAMNLLRRAFLQCPFPRNESTHEFVMNGYYGGRVEAFRYAGKGLYYYDFNSSYPFAMLSDMPGELIGKYEGTIIDFEKHPNAVGFMRCDVFVPEMEIPPLPVKGDGETAPKKLLFPTGNLTGTWEWSELEHAISCGCEIRKIHESVWYEGQKLFEDFVNTLYPLRKTGDLGLAMVVKLILNACYGKTGQRKLRTKILWQGDPELNKDGATPATGDIDSPVWYVEEEVDAPYIIPQVAARVTAIARVRLHKAMMRVLELGGHVYYCDTDSIITDIELPSSTALGELKDEYPEYSGELSACFLGPKMYFLSAGEVDEAGTQNAVQDFEQVKAKGIELKRELLTEKAVRTYCLEQLFQRTKKRRCPLTFDSIGLGEDSKRRLDSKKKPLETVYQYTRRIIAALRESKHEEEALSLEKYLRKAVLCRRINRHKFKLLQAHKTLRQWRFEKVGMLARDGFSHGPRMFMVERTLHAGGEKRERIPGTNETRAFNLELWSEAE